MSIRRVKIVLLCEDSQHEAFARRFLKGMGWNTRELRVEKSPSASSSAEQWVRKEFPNELKVYRRRSPASALIAMIDADSKDIQDRIKEFEDTYKSRHVPFRHNGEAVAIVVPRRNIETWIHYLSEKSMNEVSEKDDYPKLDKERSCKPAVNHLVEQCKSTWLNPNAPPALKRLVKSIPESE